MAHEMAALWLKNSRMPPHEKFPDLDIEDIEAVEKYVDFCESLIGDRNDPDIQFWIEHRFDMSDIYPELFGTVDFAVYSRRHKTLLVCDYKNGAGLPVEVKENSQLKFYGVGALHELRLPAESVELVIVQPRASHPEGDIRKWKTTSEALFNFLGDLISDAEKTKDPNAELVVGEHCKWCPAAANACPKIRDRAIAVSKESFVPGLAYDPSKLSECLNMLPTMEAWIKGVREFAVREAQAGRTPPGWKIVGKRPSRKWKEGWSGERLAQEFGLKPPEMYDQKVKSPAQVEKIIDKVLKPRVELLVNYVSSGYKLVEDQNPEPALSESEIDSFTLIEV